MKGGLVVGVIVGVGLMGGLPAGAASSTAFANCTALHHTHRYGVAKSVAAANRQVNSGHWPPFVSLSGYNANSRLDADKDGTACEVTR